MERPEDRVRRKEKTAAVKSAARRRGVEAVPDLTGLQRAPEVDPAAQRGGQVGKTVGVDQAAHVVTVADELVHDVAREALEAAGLEEVVGRQFAARAVGPDKAEGQGVSVDVKGFLESQLVFVVVVLGAEGLVGGEEVAHQGKARSGEIRVVELVDG